MSLKHAAEFNAQLSQSGFCLNQSKQLFRLRERGDRMIINYQFVGNDADEINQCFSVAEKMDARKQDFASRLQFIPLRRKIWSRFDGSVAEAAR